MDNLTLKLLHTRIYNQDTKERFHPQSDAGFTLIEVLVVVLIIAVLAAIAAPGWLAFVNRQRVNKANDAVLAALQEGQREAQKKKLSYSISFTTDNTTKIPRIAVYPKGYPPDTFWRDLSRDLQINGKQILLGTNLSSANTAATSVTFASSFDSSAPQTITFDYMGVLAAKTNGNSADTELKIVLAVPQTNNSASSVKRCVIVKTLLGTMAKGKDSDCN
ncbi:prepilin-type N-terminal cleavage/methylation domain-containing protein [Nostoc punctiforme FACHB-252]|uniref:Prepilin-type N-terminal cleavage/methylation domain-containing protein n=1 Tax=Nostoc punctiforme FACHB-252 TaxID=1357509 RepID=A0ABR8HCB8_NOSPU|nr:prepilin-type N-terminal cleavage/methylation domain-containing protein [Nostoc punctiforme]MBD2613384.1 prepilin-type N-terminal cleavage/methylation domain-containing protein [Nostoc punctiforme FACHB-252]